MDVVTAYKYYVSSVSLNNYPTTAVSKRFVTELTTQVILYNGINYEDGFTVNATEDSPSNFFNWSSFTIIDIGWIIIYSIMLSMAVLGNIVVIWIVLAHRSMRTVTNYFLLNLSVADLILATFNGTPNFYYMLQNEWVLGHILCVINNFVAIFTVAACVFTMTAISIDRWMAIIRPLEPRMTKGSARRAIVAIWVGSAALGAPCLYYSGLENDETGRVLCLVVWPDGSPISRSTIDLGFDIFSFFYNICFMTVTYILPMVAMALCYGSMSWELWGQQQIGEITQRQINSTISKRKVVRMFIVVVTTFAVCWLPYHAYFIYQYLDNSIVYLTWIKHLYLAFYFLAMSTSMINPIVYYFMNTRFRNYIQEVAYNFFCCHRIEAHRRRNYLVNTPPMFRRYSQSCSRSRSGTVEENQQPRYPKTLIVNTQMYYYHHPMANLNQNSLLANGRNRLHQNVADPAVGYSGIGRLHSQRYNGAFPQNIHQQHPLSIGNSNGNGNSLYCNTYC